MKEAQKQAEEAKKREEQQRKLEAERQKREKERLKREEERLKKEEEKKRRQKEERERAAEKERQRKEKEEKDRKEKEILKEKERKEKEKKAAVVSQNELDSTKNKSNSEKSKSKSIVETAIEKPKSSVATVNSKSTIITNDVKTQKIDQTSSFNKNNILDNDSNTASFTSSSTTSQTESNLNNHKQQSQPQFSEATRQQILIEALVKPSKTHDQTQNLPPVTSTTPNPITNNHFSSTSTPLQQQHSYNNFSHFDRLQQPTFHSLIPTQSEDSNNIVVSVHHNPPQPLATLSSSLPPHPPPIGLLNQPPHSSVLNNGFLPIAPPMETSLSASGITGRSSLGTIGQPHLSISSSASTVSQSTVPGIAIPSHHGRRASAMAGPIGSPVNHRYTGLTSDHHDTNGSLSHKTSTDNSITATDNSFFSSFLFGEPNKNGKYIYMLKNRISK